MNGTSLTVADYHDFENRYLTDTLYAGEAFPVYKLTPPTVAEHEKLRAQWILLNGLDNAS